MNSDINHHFRCLNCFHGSLNFDEHKVSCPNCGYIYSVVNNVPVFLNCNNQLFPPAAFLPNAPKSKALINREIVSGLGKFLPRLSVNLSSNRCIEKFANLLTGLQSALVLVVGGGSQRKWLDKRFAEHLNIRLVYIDIDRNSLVDVFCDAHELPFLDGSFDGVITTAVLQHVLYPEKAIAEIHRVLKPNGLIYSEIAFMQQVIEGAYDFTRYTLSGHRRIFNHFDELDSGLVAGPATTLLWAIENFILAFIRRMFIRLIVKSLIRLMFFWIKYFDYLLKSYPQAIDGASCTFFLGRKRVIKVPDIDIIKSYKGAKHLEHT